MGILEGVFGYIRDVFSIACPASFARWATVPTIITGCWALVYLVHKNHTLPDALSLGALGVWMVAPYGISKISAKTSD